MIATLSCKYIAWNVYGIGRLKVARYDPVPDKTWLVKVGM